MSNITIAEAIEMYNKGGLEREIALRFYSEDSIRDAIIDQEFKELKEISDKLTAGTLFKIKRDPDHIYMVPKDGALREVRKEFGRYRLTMSCHMICEYGVKMDHLLGLCPDSGVQVILKKNALKSIEKLYKQYIDNDRERINGTLVTLYQNHCSLRHHIKTMNEVTDFYNRFNP